MTRPNPAAPSAPTEARGFDRPWARVPAWVGPALLEELESAAEEIITAVRKDVPDFARPMTGKFGMRITEGVTVALRQFFDLLGHDEPVADTRVYRALGQLEHNEGRTLAALQASYQVGCRTLWRKIGTGEVARRLPQDVVFGLAEALFTYIEVVSSASVDGWAAEESGRAGSVQSRRTALVELMSRQPPAPSADLERAAAEAGWWVPVKVAALVVDEAVAVAGRLPGSIGADLGPSGVVLMAEPDAAAIERITLGLRGRVGVLGPSVDAAEAARSIVRARAVFALHRTGQLGCAAGAGGPLLRAEEHLLALLVAADQDAADALRERALGPLRNLPAAGAERAEETLRAWLDAHGDVATTADRLHVHPQTVRYRLAGLRETFGDALDDPVRRLEMALALRFPRAAGSTADRDPDG